MLTRLRTLLCSRLTSSPRRVLSASDPAAARELNRINAAYFFGRLYVGLPSWI